MRYIQRLKEIGFDFSVLPEDIKEAVDLLLTSNADNSKIDALDYTTLCSIREVVPNDNMVEELYEVAERHSTVNENNGFNTTSSIDQSNVVFDSGSEKSKEISFIEYKGKQIMYSPHFEEYYVDDEPFSTLEQAKEYIDRGNPTPEWKIDAYSKGLFAEGGTTSPEVVFEDKYLQIRNIGGDKVYYKKVNNEWEFLTPEELKQLKIGTKHELEHKSTIQSVSDTKNIEDVASAIAWDHISERIDYYDRLERAIPEKMEKGEYLKRADGSYSRRGLWDNIRDNIGSGKEPTPEMLEQERKIKAEAKKYADGGVPENTRSKEEQKKAISTISLNISDYKNPYSLNISIEKWIDDKIGADIDNALSRSYTPEEKQFLKGYTGFGGLGQYGEISVGSMFEFFTPLKVIETMWSLAYKYGYKSDGSVLEPSCGTGEFLQFTNPLSRVVGYEINKYSAIITKILYPYATIKLSTFEKVFIDKNFTIKDKTDKLEKFDLVIGNPPYGSFDVLDAQATRYLLGMGEKDFTKASNYVEYFLRRSLDLTKPGGLLVMIVGTEVRNGGTMFLDSRSNPVKEYLNANATLLDAYRLPDSIFERTGVTSDILVIQKNK